MRIKKNSAVYFVIFLFTLIHLKAFPQSFKYSTSGNFTVDLDTIRSYDENKTSPYYTVFIETGDGRYFKSDHIDATIARTFYYSYNHQINAGSKAIATISSYYDTTPRPPRNVSISVRNENSDPASPQTEFTNNPSLSYSRVNIDPCVDWVVAGDTMTVALSYKPYTASDNIIAFFYNKTEAAGDIFSIINNKDLDFNDGKHTKSIRIHNRETIYYDESSLPTGLPQDVLNLLTVANHGYTNAVYFFSDGNSDEFVKNIFLTLAPFKSGERYQGNSTSLAALLIKYNNTELLDQTQLLVKDLRVDLVARDPNGIDAGPECLNSPFDQKIPIKIFFRNDGTGDAKDVIADLQLPKGIAFPSELNNVVFYKDGSSYPVSKWAFGIKNPYYYQLDKNRNKITFSLIGVNLPGTARKKVRISGRMGFIKCMLYTKKSPGPVDNCLPFNVWITFKNTNGQPNRPIPGHDTVRSNCIIAGGCKR